MTTRPKRFAVLRRVVNGAVVATALVAAARAEMPAPESLQAMDASHLNISSVVAELMTTEQASQDTITRKKPPAPPTVVRKRAATKQPIRNASADSAPELVVRYREMKSDSATPLPRTEVRVLKRDTGVYVFVDSLGGRKTYTVGSRGIDSSRVANFRADTVVLSNGTTFYSRDSSGARIRVRGQATPLAKSASGDPLVIVDGVIVRPTDSKSATGEPLVFVDGVLMKPGSLDLIKASAIESIEVLKGAAAIATYGLAAEHGVIVIKMKKP